VARPFHPKLAIFNSDKPDKEIGSYFAVPAFFTDALMRVGKGIPPAFWKMTFVLLREVLKPKKVGGEFVYPYECKTTVEWFAERHINDRAVQDWTNAYFCSGLFQITKGRSDGKENPGIPTVWRYNVNASKADWIAFVKALSNTLLGVGKRMRRTGTGPDGQVAAHAFMVALAFEVDNCRADGTVGRLPLVNQKMIDDWIAEGRANTIRTPDGGIQYSYTTKQNDRKRSEYGD